MDLGGQKYKLRLYIIYIKETIAEIICLSGGIFCYNGNKTLQKVNRIRNERS